MKTINKTSKVIIFFIWLVLIVCSCNGDKKESGKYSYDEIRYNNESLWKKSEFYPNGRIKVEQSYKEIIPDSFVGHGFMTYYYSTGEVEFHANLDNGNKIGTVHKYYRNGQFKEIAFFNPLGQALYMIKYDSMGNVTEELGKDQRFPIVITKLLKNDSIELKVYSVNIPGNYKNVYLTSSQFGRLDSIKNTNADYDIFIVPRDTGLFEISVDYLSSINDIHLKTDQTQFRLPE